MTKGLILLGVALITSGFVAEGAVEMSRDEIFSLSRKVVEWQIANPAKGGDLDWATGPFWNGVMAMGQATGDDWFFEQVRTVGERYGWGVKSTNWPPNDHCTPQTWLEMYEREKNPAMLAPILEALNKEMAIVEQQDDDLSYKKENFHKWSWCDALFMAPPTFVRLSAVTGDPRYRDFVHKWWWKVSDFYYDKEEQLYFRDQRFFKRREANGEKVFWSRGVGWVVGGLVRVLQYLPEDDPMRPKYVQELREQCERLASIQSKDGLWHGSLLYPEGYAPETSGSAFMIYAMAYGVNQKMLDAETFLPVIKKGWAGLLKYVKEDGQFTGVQPIGDKPVSHSEEHSEPYGTGAFLLAASEVYRMIEK